MSIKRIHHRDLGFLLKADQVYIDSNNNGHNDYQHFHKIFGGQHWNIIHLAVRKQPLIHVQTPRRIVQETRYHDDK